MKLTLFARKGSYYVALINPQSANEFIASGGTIEVSGTRVSRYGKNAVRSLKDATVQNNLRKLKRLKG